MFPAGREALLRAPMVAEALRAVTEKGLCKQSRELASAALMALSDTELQLITSGQLHVMLSCEFAKPSPRFYTV